ncbi:LysR substrate-binding domain-containing protein [Lentibacter sp. XHP0401]|jgi:LysR family transcriptional regulator, hydrogen peroxide-inducible genes activator|uniref:LysR substrate-binding domain-containing protein n=1 Tax=Lentibacter sp. XHP0401 TaxID=2984334 RepID=UPI0021E8AC74|nr:LysR substrate-binding domain-containing protein [Lentibacter sp. XHP0401]MCV2893500.1 LysR substrate-binding domain-containing protein [Lentibacter sp. XHP0401]
MANITLRQLRYFEALASQGHFGRAAEVCSVSQPALSMQIKELEGQLGMALFERAARQVRLTAFGEDFAGHARQVLRGAEELGEMARKAQEEFSGRLRLGVIPTIAPYLLPRVFKALAATYPRLDIQVRETVTSKLLAELDEGRLDTAIVALPISEPSFEEVRLFEESFVLVRPEGDSDLPIPSADSLSRMRLLLLEEGHCFRDQALSVCSLPQVRPRDGFDASSLSTLVQMVGAGMGVTLIPEMAVPVETRSAAVALARFAAPEPTRTVGMVWRKSSPLIAQLRDVAAVVRSAAAEA